MTVLQTVTINLRINLINFNKSLTDTEGHTVFSVTTDLFVMCCVFAWYCGIVYSLILAAITLHGRPWEHSSTKNWLREPAVPLSESS